MKKYISVFTIMVMIFMAACSNQNTSSTPTSNENNTQSNSVTKLDEGVWPANEYTEGLPVAPGTVAWATLDTEHENCNINLTGISENDYNEYVKTSPLRIKGHCGMIKRIKIQEKRRVKNKVDFWAHLYKGS